MAKQQQKKTRRRFSDEFNAETVKLAKQSDRSMADLAMARYLKWVSACARAAAGEPARAVRVGLA